ncbi:DUF421 domain-containing protein [Paenibacillus lautus]|uniref:DUF421 domain-containing protein n=1 Tax=Paenibacillus lautus TaxID=1401 RepID=UPI002DB5904B|nr:DUF421 domain-containing protein [Paenibacillus lautus]MEC0253981.1 DUF421 domain-containing protein [Paenibacillus lautus]
MDFHFIWKAVVIVAGGVLILRFAGRKSISQLTVAQTVMMIAVGSLIIQPVGDRNIWITMLITLLMVITLIGIEYSVLKSDALETFLYGKSKMVVENGKINERNLSKMRLSVDMLEVRLRQQGIQKISDLQWATIEPNGQLGYMLKSGKRYATKDDIDRLITILQASLPHLSIPLSETKDTGNDLFTEVQKNQHGVELPNRLK